MNIRIKKPGNYLIGRLEFCSCKCCSEMVWENQECRAGEEFEEWQIDTEFMNRDEYEEVAA